VVSLERPEKDINRYIGFLSFIFHFEYLKRLQSSEPIHNSSNTSNCWDHGLYGHKPQSFPPNRAPKMREIQQLLITACE
jgi:hypothetical protein